MGTRQLEREAELAGTSPGGGGTLMSGTVEKATRPVDPSPRPEMGKAPRRLGPLVLGEVLGAGAMGAVYLAELVESRPYGELGDRFAVKIAHPHLPGRDAVERFRREGRLGRQVRHEAIVAVHETGSLRAEGQVWHFLVEDLVEGGTLKDLLREGALPEPLLRHLTVQVASGLHAIHEAGAVHRDLKPSNICLTPDHVVKVLDLGVAHLLDGDEGLTAEGAFMGTLRYASPEHFGQGRMGPSADLYSLGVILHEAATGERFIPSCGPTEAMRAHLEKPPEKVGRLNPGISPFLEEVIDTLLQKQPDKRMASAAQLSRVVREGESSKWWRNRERSLRAADPRGRLRRVRSPRGVALVGRELELTKLDQRLTEARRGLGRVVVVQGEAGIGKSHLVDEFLTRVESSGTDTQVLHGRNRPGGVRGHHGGLARAIRDHLGDVDLVSGLARYLSADARIVESFAAWLVGRGLSTGPERLEAPVIETLLCELLRGLATEAPVAWALEDCHHASPEERSRLAALLRVAPDLPVLLVLITRDPDDVDGLEALDPGVVLPLDVGRLDDDAICELVAHRLGSKAVAETLHDRLLPRCGGNPFFVLELLRDLESQGFLDKGEGRSWRLVRDVDEVELPSSVRSLVTGRLRGLSPDERALLELASVQGESFQPELLAASSGTKLLQVLEILASLERRGGLVFGTGAGFQFDHPQLQEALYQELPPDQRREDHSRLASALMEREGLDGSGPPAEGDLAVTLVTHLLFGGRVAESRPHLLPAFEHLRAHGHPAELLELVGLALEGLREDDRVLRCELYLTQARCLHRLGRRDEEKMAAQFALLEAQEAGDDRHSARAHIALGRHAKAKSLYVQARSSLVEAVELARLVGDLAIEAEAAGRLGGVAQDLGEVDVATRAIEHQLELCEELGDRAGEAEATGQLGSVHRDLGRYDAARGCFEKQLRIAEREKRAGSRASALNRLGGVSLLQGDLSEARRCFETAQREFRSACDRGGEANVAGNLGAACRDLGLLGEARERLEQARELLKEMGSIRGETLALAHLANVARDEGRVADARAMLEQARDLAQRFVMPRLEADIALQLGECHRMSGEPDQAIAQLDRAHDVLEKVGTPGGLPAVLLARGRIHWELDNRDDAIADLRRARALHLSEQEGEVGVLPAAYLGAMGLERLQGLVVPMTAPARVRAEAHLVLYLAGGPLAHLRASLEVLSIMAENLSDGDAQRFWRVHPTAKRARELRGDGSSLTCNAGPSAHAKPHGRGRD
ncbi:MAG: tetratricopeptide repeat protein [Acidobacteriota bacterium]